MKKYIRSSDSKFDGYTLVKSVTRQCRPLIHNSDIRRNTTAIYLVYDPDTYDYDKDDYKDYYYLIFFRTDTVKNCYSGDYINYGTAAPMLDQGPEYSINQWVDEVTYIED